ncbi:twin-arginine translocation signal domain-containing protein, partial [Pseudoalteromonas ruthenica]
MTNLNRRDFLKAAGVAAAAGVVSGCAQSKVDPVQATPERQGKSVIGLIAPKMD